MVWKTSSFFDVLSSFLRQSFLQNCGRNDVVYLALYHLTITAEPKLESDDGKLRFYDWRADITPLIQRNWFMFWLKTHLDSWINSLGDLSRLAGFVSAEKLIGPDNVGKGSIIKNSVWNDSVMYLWKVCGH